MARGDDRVRRFRTMWADEVAGAAMYRALAQAATGEQREILNALADAEQRHADHWRAMLEKEGEPLPHAGRLPLRVRVIGALARRFGASAVLPWVIRMEAADASKYDAVAEAPASMAASERGHGRVVAALGGATVGGGIARAERRHRVGAGGALRAAVFGANDGLVSNLSLVMGVAGGTANARFVMLAGVAGLVAGAFSMAAGEWVSVRSQRELYEREIEVEREELEHFPEEEREELELIYRAKGIDAAQAREMADQIMSSGESALDTLAKEELGLDPADLVSPWVAAWTSFLTFAVGALVPVIPYLVAGGTAAFVWAAVSSGVGLFLVGTIISVFTGRGALRAGARQIAIGAAAAAATYGIGNAIGVGVGG